MESLTPLAKTTIAVSWLLMGLACMSTIGQLVWLRIKKSRFSVADGRVCVALVVSISLVAQTTWAMVDEGSGRHQSDMERGNIAAVAKVVGTCTLLQQFI
jgi:hypothetical protein